MSTLDLVAAISTDVVARLAAASLPALVDGAILLGPQHDDQHASPPRIIFDPVSNTFDRRSPTQPLGPSDSSSYKAMLANPWLLTDIKRFRVNIWGVRYVSGAPSTDPDQDYSYTEAMRDVLFQSLYALMGGNFIVGPGKWIDSLPTAPKLMELGRMFETTIDIATPVLQNTIPFVPSGTTGELTVYPSTASPTGPDAVVINT